MGDVKGLVADARGYAKADAGYSKALLEDLADALEAATDALERVVLDDYTAAEIVAGVRSARDYLAALHPGCPGCEDCSRQSDLDLAASALEELCAERALVEAQALEKAAKSLGELPADDDAEVIMWVAERLCARAVEIREG